MKISCPIFSFAIATVLVMPAQAETPSSVVESGGASASQSGSSSQEAEALVERVEQTIDQLQSLSAKVRNQVDLFEQQVIGTGIYLQQGSGLRQLSRFELKSQVGDATYTLREISDGHFFWTFRELPTGRSLNRVDLDRIQVQLQSDGRTASNVSPGPMSIGGLSKMIAGLRQNFQFDRAAQTQLRDHLVWVVDGQWRPAQLAAAVPELRGAIEAGRPIEWKKLPAHLPEHVVLYVGQSDWIPYRIEYLRRIGKSDVEGQGGILPGYRAIVTTEFFDVRLNAPMDAREFVYQPSGLTQPNGLKPTDTTDAYLKMLRGEPAK
ncbi:MAG TPA: hypothetical protein VGY55_25330 [Pirellulales bacterium]|jgi:hypothetical protein|nr:hypothetical protein [Pirellulales bacterium]